MSIFNVFGQGKKRGLVPRDEGFRIEDRGYERVLKYDGITYSKLRGRGIYTGEYWDYFLPVAYAFATPSILLIGLGGGTIAFQLSRLMSERLRLDVVELSQRAVDLSRRFAPAIKANVMVGDGAEYVAATGKRYDAILLDAYTSSQIPEQFLQKKFVDDAYNALSDDGVLAINYAMGMMGILRFAEYTKKLKERFRVYKVNTAVFEGNVILVCSKRLGKEELLDRIRARMPGSSDNEFLARNYSRMDRL